MTGNADRPASAVALNTPPATDPVRLREDIYAHLAARIIARDIAPGTRITDREIAEDLGVSRQPVRECFLQLVNEGLLDVRASRFTHVTEVSEGESDDALRFVLSSLRIAIHESLPAMRQEDLLEADALLGALAEAIGRSSIAATVGFLIEILDHFAAGHFTKMVLKHADTRLRRALNMLTTDGLFPDRRALLRGIRDLQDALQERDVAQADLLLSAILLRSGRLR